ncbi:DUF3784 domain-containing protein [Brumimicrobium aurantiacum]|uniref:DUF3784 domain-containing protein n=1 Tax=Brumimicrobium aurantiacum TaxID=1737063 RepID=A0A3E1EV47_9FLAO|nr:DUF3784 domain-containing protein [Brumimicrobium aurantiacum]RFC53410.1 DUF3784 domain-containing protein [Brumimicrobium aurantiacum]
MITTVILSILFLGIAFILTPKNAGLLLAGYNTMSDEEKEKFDLHSFISFFKRFHIILAFTLLIVGLSIHQFGNALYSGIFTVCYPILAYIYFILKSSKYHDSLSKRRNKAGVFILLGVLIFTLVLMFLGLRENKLTIHTDRIEISGMYSVDLKLSEIESFQLIHKKPETSAKINGYALGGIYKGYFKLVDGEKVKLLLNSSKLPIVVIHLKNGKEIYYSAKEKSNEKLFEQLQALKSEQ